MSFVQSGRKRVRGYSETCHCRGALLECTSIRPAVGDAIIVAFPGNLDREPGVLHGAVVRLTPDGCGIKFPGYSSADFDIVTSYEEAD